MTATKKTVNIYWQNEALELRAKIDEIERKVEVSSFGYELLLKEIRNLKEYLENRFRKTEREYLEPLRYKIK